jgi:RNA polymerase sigma-70 factor (ECF subfamily)
MDTPADIEVVPGARPGPGSHDRDTLRALYPHLRRLAAVVADTDMDPDDLVQDAVTGYLRIPPGAVRDAGAYLRRAVVNAAGRERRRWARARAAAPLVGHETDGPPPAYPSDAAAVLACLAPVDRALLYLLDVDGFPVADAAAVTGLSVVAARARASRARRTARRALEGGKP